MKHASGWWFLLELTSHNPCICVVKKLCWTLFAGAACGNRENYFYRLKNYCQAAKLFDFAWCHDLGVGGGKSIAQVFECLLPFIMAVSFAETLYRDAVNWVVIDVVRMGTWCHRSGPLRSALQLGWGLEGGSLSLLKPSSKCPFFPEMIQF